MSYYTMHDEDARLNFFRSDSRFQQRQHLLHSSLQDPSFNPVCANSLSVELYRDSLRKMLICLFTEGLEPEVRWGFKEIRYDHPTVLRLFIDLFPKSQFIILRRNPIDVICSHVIVFFSLKKWYALETDGERKKWFGRLQTA